MQPGRRLAASPSARVLALALCALAPFAARPADAHAKRHHHPAAAAREARADSLQPLSPADARAYASAFAAVREGRFAAAEAIGRTVADPLLLGRLQYAKLMHPAYAANYDELADWLERYRDQAGAESIYALARKKKPWAAAPPASPEAAAGGAESALWARVESLAERIEAAPPAPPPPEPTAAPSREAAAPTRKVDPALQAAREAFYRGEVEKAFVLASKAGERWIAGLAAYRLKKYDEARGRFAALAQDETENDWVRSAGGYWAARAAVGAGAPEAAPQYLQLAARTPYTFYGLIAERELGLDPGVDGTASDAAAGAQGVGRAPLRADPVLGRLIRADARARRAAAYAQLGMKAEAGAELRAGLLGAAGATRQGWMRLGLALNAPLTSPSDLSRASQSRLALAQYPTPDLAPEGGFTLDKALVYALVRQESRFDAGAASASGAYGLMQLTPATAARVAGDDKLKADPTPLRDPGVNLRLGQAYVAKLLSALNGDLLHAVAAYNSGPGVIQKTLAQLGKNADPLLAIESMPGAQTRDFVQRVMAGYWIYRSKFGQDSPSLDAAASGRKAVAATLDQAPAAKLPSGPLASLFGARP